MAARGTGAGLSGRLRVSAAVTFARLMIVPRLGAFLKQHPQLEIELVLNDRNVDLVGEGIDIALRMGHLGDSTLSARKLASLRRMVLATPRYFAREGQPQGPEDLSRHEAVIYSVRGGGNVWTFTRNGTEKTVALREFYPDQSPLKPCEKRFLPISASPWEQKQCSIPN